MSIERLYRLRRRLTHLFNDLIEQAYRVRGGRKSSPRAGFGIARVALPIFVLLLIYPFYLAAPVAYLFYPSALQKKLLATDAARLRPAVYDAQGHFMGALGGSGSANTIFVEHPNRDYLACLRYREDRNRGNPLINPFGNDVMGVMRGFGRSGGGSTVTAMLQQQLGVRKGDGEGKPAKYWRKFAELYSRTPQMSALIMRGPPNLYDQLAARHLTHIQATGAAGTTWGIEAAAQTTFGKSQEQMSRLEAFMLAGAVLNNYRFRYGTNTGRFDNAMVFDYMADPALRVREPHECQRLAAGAYKGTPLQIAARSRCTWNRMLKSAGLCAGNPTLVPDGAERAAMLAELDRLHIDFNKSPKPDGTGSLPVPKADPLVDSLGAAVYRGFAPHVWDARKNNSFDRESALFGNASRALETELRDAFGAAWNSKVARVNSSIDLVEERRFTPQYRESLRAFLRKLDISRQLNSIYHPWVTYAGGQEEPKDRPDAVLAIADGDGRIVRFHEAGEFRVYAHGYMPCNVPPPVLCPYDPRQERMQVASIGKILGAMVLAKTGNAGMIVDNRPVRKWLAVSNTEEIIAALERADPSGQVGRQLIDALHWHDASVASGGTGPDRMAKTLSFGNVTAAPRTVHQLVSGLARWFAGQPGPVSAPTFVKQLRYLDLPAGKLTPVADRLPSPYSLHGTPLGPDATLEEIDRAVRDPAGTIDVARLIPADRREDLKTLLEAPVCDRRADGTPNGTLSALIEWCNSSRAKFVFGKTGTLDVSEAYARVRGLPFRKGVVRAIWSAGGIQLGDGRIYSFVFYLAGRSLNDPLTIGTPSGQIDLEAKQAGTLLRAALRDLEQHPPTGGHQ